MHNERKFLGHKLCPKTYCITTAFVIQYVFGHQLTRNAPTNGPRGHPNGSQVYCITNAVVIQYVLGHNLCPREYCITTAFVIQYVFGHSFDGGVHPPPYRVTTAHVAVQQLRPEYGQTRALNPVKVKRDTLHGREFIWDNKLGHHPAIWPRTRS